MIQVLFFFLSLKFVSSLLLCYCLSSKKFYYQYFFFFYSQLFILFTKIVFLFKFIVPLYFNGKFIAIGSVDDLVHVKWNSSESCTHFLICSFPCFSFGTFFFSISNDIHGFIPGLQIVKSKFSVILLKILISNQWKTKPSHILVRFCFKSICS